MKLSNFAPRDINKQVGSGIEEDQNPRYLNKDIHREIKDVTLNTICAILRDEDLPWNAPVELKTIQLREHIATLNEEYVENTRKNNKGKKDAELFSEFARPFNVESFRNALIKLDDEGLIKSENEGYALNLTDKAIQLIKKTLFETIEHTDQKE